MNNLFSSSNNKSAIEKAGGQKRISWYKHIKGVKTGKTDRENEYLEEDEGYSPGSFFIIAKIAGATAWSLM